jgi:hypothetical protein
MQNCKHQHFLPIEKLKEWYITKKLTFYENVRYDFLKYGVEVMTLLLKRCQIRNPSTETAEWLFHLRLLHQTPTLEYYSLAFSNVIPFQSL